MAKIIVYNNPANTMEVYYRGENDSMPYNTGQTLTVEEFRGSSNSNVLWTDRNSMETWNEYSDFYGLPIPFGFAFKRIWEGGHGQQSQHYAGTAFDTGQALPPAELEMLRQAAHDFGKWSYVEPTSISPTWVHTDKRFGTPACSAGYPEVATGSRGNYVLILQDALNALGFVTGSPDGIFGNSTATALRAFQRSQGIPESGVTDCATWTAIVDNVVGIGRTSTVID